MVSPSARGSLNGNPSSIQSAPASTRAGTSFKVESRSGDPAVRNRISPVLPSLSICWNFRASLSWSTLVKPRTQSCALSFHS